MRVNFLLNNLVLFFQAAQVYSQLYRKQHIDSATSMRLDIVLDIDLYHDFLTLQIVIFALLASIINAS